MNEQTDSVAAPELGALIAGAETVIDAREVVRNFHDGEKDLHILRGASLLVRRGECVAVIGRSGTGKSTLLNILGLLDKPNSGQVEICDYDALRLSQTQRTRLRGRAIGFIYQQHHLLADFNALENVMVAAAFRGAGGGRAEALELLARVGLGDRLRHRPGKLSGGEQQRVAIARALYGNPALLLCDEPTGNLDPATGGEVMDMLWDLVRAQDAGMVLVTHDMEIASRADRIVVLEDGALHPAQRAD